MFDPYREYSFLLSCVRVCLCVCGFLATLSQLLVSATYNVGVTSGTKPSLVWAGTLHVEIKLLGFLLSACQKHTVCNGCLFLAEVFKFPLCAVMYRISPNAVAERDSSIHLVDILCKAERQSKCALFHINTCLDRLGERLLTVGRII